MSKLISPFLFSMINKSSEYIKSPTFAIIKLYILSLGKLSLSIKEKNNCTKLLICYQSSYSQKPHIYDQIADKLQCNLGIFNINYSNSRSTNIETPIQKYSEIYIWSDVQIKARILLSRPIFNTKKIFTYQHGAFPEDRRNSTREISNEWINTRSTTYFSWTNQDKENILSDRPDLNVITIGEPSDSTRKLIDGFCFGTRGVEFMQDDIINLAKNSIKSKSFSIYFHPSYKRVDKLIFCIRSRVIGISSVIGNPIYINNSVVTLSRSFKQIAENSGAKIL